MRLPKPLKPWHSLRMRRGDTVVVISGRAEDKGKRGRIIRVISRREQVVVEGINITVKHRRVMRQRSTAQLQQGRIEMPAPLHRSKVMLICPRCDKPTRVTMVKEGDTRARVCRKCKETIDV